ncbi:MAG: LuxR C-terminal-related transcriptional regulator [Paracoccaceae bacterium]
MQFIDEAARATTPDEVISAMRGELATQDIAYFSHRTIIDPSRTINHSTMPREWLDHYQGSSYFRIDPGLQRVRTATGPIHMSFDERHPTYTAKGRARTMFEEMTSFKARGSYFVPFRESRAAPAASVNFLTDRDGRQFDLWLDEFATTLNLYAVVAHTRIYELMRPRPCGVSDGNPLAARERECLQWLAQGLKSDRIAERMGISDRTVEFHLRNARSKLNAATREHALAKALIGGLIEI